MTADGERFVASSDMTVTSARQQVGFTEWVTVPVTPSVLTAGASYTICMDCRRVVRWSNRDRHARSAAHRRHSR